MNPTEIESISLHPCLFTKYLFKKSNIKDFHSDKKFNLNSIVIKKLWDVFINFFSLTIPNNVLQSNQGLKDSLSKQLNSLLITLIIMKIKLNFKN